MDYGQVSLSLALFLSLHTLNAETNICFATNRIPDLLLYQEIPDCLILVLWCSPVVEVDWESWWVCAGDERADHCCTPPRN